MCDQDNASVGGGILVYRTEDGTIRLDVRLEDETVWLTQQMMAELFQSSKQNISYHVQAIYEERELDPESTVKKYLTVRREGNRDVRRELEHYNLNMIIKEALGEADYVKQLEEAARQLPTGKGETK